MIKLIKHIAFFLFVLIIAGVSCIKDDLEEIDNEQVFNSEYSLPIGSKEINLKEFVPQNLTPLTPQDTVGIPSKFIFDYNSKYFERPKPFTTAVYYLPFDFSKLTKNFDSINSLMIRLNTYNNIPAQFKIQVSLDIQDTIVNTDILYLWEPIEAATFSNNGVIITTEQSKNDININKDKIKGYEDVRKIIIQVNVSDINPSNKIIKYVSTQSLKVQLALRFSFESTSNEI